MYRSEAPAGSALVIQRQSSTAAPAAPAGTMKRRSYGSIEGSNAVNLSIYQKNRNASSGASLTATLDAAILEAKSLTATLDAVIDSGNSKTVTLDAAIKATATVVALLDSYIFDPAAPVVATAQTPAGKPTRNTRRRYILPDDTVVMATPDEVERLVALFVKPKPVKKVSKVVKELRRIDLVEFKPQPSDTVETERIVVKPRKAVWETTTDVYEKAMKLLADREIKRRRQEEELILLYA
jgi:hypothetical protein